MRKNILRYGLANMSLTVILLFLVLCYAAGFFIADERRLKVRVTGVLINVAFSLFTAALTWGLLSFVEGYLGRATTVVFIGLWLLCSFTAARMYTEDRGDGRNGFALAIIVGPLALFGALGLPRYHWRCKKCGARNPRSAAKCPACETAGPG